MSQEEQINQEDQELKKDLLAEYGEIIIDSLKDGETLEEIPIIKTGFSVFKLFNIVREKRFQRRFRILLEVLRNQRHSTHISKKIKDRFEQDKSFQDQTLESLIIEIERLENDEKVVVLSRLFLALIENQINWKKFRDLCGILERAHLLALECLSTQTPSTINRIRIDHKIRESHTPIPCDLQEALLLEASGLGLRSETIVDNSKIVILTPIGRELFVFGIHPVRLTPIGNHTE